MSVDNTAIEEAEKYDNITKSTKSYSSDQQKQKCVMKESRCTTFKNVYPSLIKLVR